MVDGFRTAAPINGLASLSIDGFPEHFAGYIARVRRCGSSQIRAHRSAARSARSIETFQRGRVIERAKGKRGSCPIIQPAFAEANSPQGPRIANYLTGERRRPRPRRLIASAISPIASSTNPATLASPKADYSGEPFALLGCNAPRRRARLVEHLELLLGERSGGLQRVNRIGNVLLCMV